MANTNHNTKTDHINRLNKVFNYIDHNLNSELSLEVLAKIAYYSPFHFHRVFKYITSETLNDYITRCRLEKAAIELLHRTANITTLSEQLGFKNLSSFTRAFKNYYGVSPSKFKAENPNTFNKIRKLNSKIGQDYSNFDDYICAITNLKNWINMQANIEVKETKAITVAGITHIGIHNVDIAFGKLIKWANSKHLFQLPSSKLGRLFYDSAKVTAPDKVRMSVFLHTDGDFEVDGEFHKINIPASKCIVGRFEIQPQEFEKAWTGLFIWMNENGYTKTSEHPYEIYHNDFREHPEQKFIVDLYIPIK